MGQIPVNLHINEAPVFSNVPEEVTVVNEASEVIVNIGLTDTENHKITVTSPNAPTWATFEVTGGELAIKLAPGYETAGTYTLNYTAIDELGAAAEMAFEVKVLKTNRAPVVISSEELVYSKLNYFDVRQFAAYFSEPDADKMTFNATVANENIVSVTIGQELGQYVIETHAAGETLLTLTATDIFGLSTVQQIKVTVVNNRAPLALGAQSIVFNKLSVQEAYNFDTYFKDPDGDQLTFMATVADPAIASIATSGNGFTVESISNGETELLLTATDIYGATAEQRVTVIVNQSEVMELNIFPNPVVNIVNIKWTNRWAGDVTIDVVALNGSTVRQFNIEDVQLKTYSQLDLSTLPTGAYFLHVSGKEGTSSVFKFIKR
ncbi:T9SS C-terminal target domain-containing protein [Flavobacterium cupreum]|uniref:T9SS C-terminal target domain-containing protein n=1 Tax=Flavobacterium cupreum TaxID=2133766 RepID=A0A434A2K6_9FLAO|nr:T9SS C-terminal target domain-containing protein [Flavobacterium cupreum]